MIKSRYDDDASIGGEDIATSIAAAETAKADYVVTSDRLFLQALPEACITPDRAVALLDIAK